MIYYTVSYRRLYGTRRSNRSRRLPMAAAQASGYEQTLSRITPPHCCNIFFKISGRNGLRLKPSQPAVPEYNLEFDLEVSWEGSVYCYGWTRCVCQHEFTTFHISFCASPADATLPNEVISNDSRYMYHKVMELWTYQKIHQTSEHSRISAQIE